MKRILRVLPSTQSAGVANEEPFSSAEATPASKVKRKLRPVRIRGTFRRIKRRPDKQYHSDDGYTSDPGLPIRDDMQLEDMDEDDETDGADSSEGPSGQSQDARRQQQQKTLEQKLEKKRQQLMEEKETYHESQAVYLQGLEGTMSDKAQQKIQNRFHRSRLKSHAMIEQNRKKIEKYEKDLTSLQEGAAKEGFRGKIGVGLRGSLTGIKKGFYYAGNTLKKGKRIIIKTRGSQEEEGEGEEVVIADLAEEEEEEEEEEEGSPSDPMLVIESDMMAVGKGPENLLLEQSKQLKRELEEEKSRVATLEEVLQEVIDTLQQSKDTTERLEGQVNDVIDLHQNAVDELRGQLAQVESMTVGKSQDLEDSVDECRSRVDKLDTMLNMVIERKAEVERARTCMMNVLVVMVTITLQLVAFSAKLVSLLRTKAGGSVALVVALLAVLFYVFVFR